MHSDTDRPSVLSFVSRTRNGHTVVTLGGELDIVCVPVLRGRLLDVLRPAACRLIVDLSQVTFCDASGLAVLVGTGRSAELLGGVLRLVSPTPAVMRVMRDTGLHRRLEIFSTVPAASASPGSVQRGAKGDVTSPVAGPPDATAYAEAPDANVLRKAVGALLTDLDAWYEADPDGRFTPTLDALARAYARSEHLALTQAARALVSALTRHPLTHSPGVAAAASRLRRIVESGRSPVRR
jgi:anti-anti-sigma factor